MKQRTDEWDDPEYEYHEKQYTNVYRSTVLFCDWLNELGFLNTNIPLNILDMCCGQGANVYYMSQRYPTNSFTGIDISEELVIRGNDFYIRKGLKNCRLLKDDLYNMQSDLGILDGIVSFQTLSWLPESKTALNKLASLDAGWIALTSLFFDGDVECRVHVDDFSIHNGKTNPRQSFYNIYSIERVRNILADYGYRHFCYMPFEIDENLPNPQSRGMGTYTEELKNGHRLQISGPLLMPWYFIAASKT